MKKLYLAYIALLLAFCALPADAAKKTRKLYVMAVGVADYKYPDASDLLKPGNDVDSIAALFCKDDAEVLVLKDAEATRDSIISKMRAFFSKSKKSDNVLFYFSGHGISKGFCPHDYAGSVRSALTYDDIKQVFQSIDAYGRMIMADACFSGKLRSNNKQESTANESHTPASTVGTPKTNQQVMLFLSSRDNEYSLENTTLPNGYFTYYLCKALKGEADANSNGMITAEELSRYVSAEVKRVSADKQHPVMWGSFNKGWIISRVINTSNDSPAE